MSPESFNSASSKKLDHTLATPPIMLISDEQEEIVSGTDIQRGIGENLRKIRDLSSRISDFNLMIIIAQGNPVKLEYIRSDMIRERSEKFFLENPQKSDGKWTDEKMITDNNKVKIIQEVDTHISEVKRMVSETQNAIKNKIRQEEWYAFLLKNPTINPESISEKDKIRVRASIDVRIGKWMESLHGNGEVLEGDRLNEDGDVIDMNGNILKIINPVTKRNNLFYELEEVKKLYNPETLRGFFDSDALKEMQERVEKIEQSFARLDASVTNN